MKLPRYATLSITLDTARWNSQPIDRHSQLYLIDRLLSGETVADDELEAHISCAETF